MPFLNNPVDLAFFIARGWHVDIPGDAAPGFEAFKIFNEKGKVLPEEDVEGRSALRMLASACLLHFQPSSRAKPFGVMAQFGGARSAAIEDFGSADVDTLATLAAAAPQLPLRARLADVAWEAGKLCQHRKWEMGVLAARTYYPIAASNLVNGDELVGREALLRGLELTWQFRRQTQNLLDEFWNLVETTAQGAHDRPNLMIFLADLCVERRSGLAPTLAPLLEQAARREMTVSGPTLQHAELWGRASKLWALAGNEAFARQARLNEAEGYISHAEAGAANAMFAAHWMKVGLESLRRSGADRDRSAAVHARLLEIQGAIQTQMRQYSQEIDVSELQAHIEKAVTGRSFEEAVFGLMRLDSLLRPERVREEVMEQANRFPLMGSMPLELTNSDGLTISRRGSLLIGSEEERADALKKESFKHASEWELRLRGEVMAPRAAQLIFDEHHPTERDVARFVAGNPLIPPGFHAGIIRGLHAGFEGDAFGAGTYLIPRMEGLIRHWLKLDGVVTSFVDDEGYQGERTLGYLLESPDAERHFGSSLCFELRCHLVEKWGYDLRNKYAHAIAPDGEIAGCGTMSLWWLLWRVILLPFMAGDANPRPAGGGPPDHDERDAVQVPVPINGEPN